MLAVTTYPLDHVAATRARFASDLAAFDALPQPTPELEHAFFANCVLALDRSFVHRARGGEGKDGNALNQVRALADSITENDGVLTVPKSIRLKSVIGLQPGDRISVDRAAFEPLAEAFFDEIEARYPSA